VIGFNSLHFKLPQPHFTTEWDDRGNIGKRYRYQDEQGTPQCVTIDFETLGEKARNSPTPLPSATATP